ncbi:MAG: class I SAM-dependent methyltransferase [Leifsonia sp.]
MPDPQHFDRNADLYDRARPPYPEALWSRLGQLGVLSAGERALDLGSGTGQAVGPLLRAGMRVTAIEPGPALAARLRTHFPDVEVVASTAEDAELPRSAFALATAATSVHWFDLHVVLPKVHAALQPGGNFAVWRNAYGDPQALMTPFRERVAEIVARRGSDVRRAPGETETSKWARVLSAGGFFVVCHVEEFRWSIELDATGLRELFTTFSDWTPSEAAEVGRAAEDLGGLIEERYVTPLIVLAAEPQ